MATQVTLKAGHRDEFGKGVARKLRASGKLPAVVYGAEADTVPLTLDSHDAEQLFRSISVDNTIVNLEVEGEKIPVPTLVREIQTHPYRPGILHVDFYRIQTGVEVELDVPVHLEGTATGVKDEGGVLEQTIHNIPVRCVPANIPEAFVLDVTILAVGDSLHVEDIELPGGVEILLEPRRAVCSVQAPSELDIEEVEEEEEPELVAAEGVEEVDAEESGDEEGEEEE